MPELTEVLCKMYWGGSWGLKVYSLMNENVFKILAVISPNATDSEEEDGARFTVIY